MYIIFFLKIKSWWGNLGFGVENTVENMVIQVLCVGIQSCTSRFRQYFDTKSKISPRWLGFQKKYGIHEKCGRASRTQNILSKVLRTKSSLSKSTKTIEICANYLLYGFLKELMMCRFCEGFEIFFFDFGFLPENQEFINEFWCFFGKLLLNLNPSKNARNRNAF